MNDALQALGIASWKPVLAALVLPPVPFLLLILIGARLILPRRGLGWLVVLLGVSLVWISATNGAAEASSKWLLDVPAPLNDERVKALRAEARTGPPAAIVVLGGGIEPFAPEYGVSSLNDASLERLRYGIWLARQTGLPLAYSGGVGWGQRSDAEPEARVAGRVAAEDFQQPLRWIEDASRDTRENAERSVALLRPAGVRKLVVVTHGWHMPRALRAFAGVGGDVAVEAAPMGLAGSALRPELEWMPSAHGLRLMRRVLHESIGRWAGA